MWTSARILVPLVLLLLAAVSLATAQDARSISGTLRSAADSTLLADVVVKLLDPSREPHQTTTSSVGAFSLRIPDGPARLLALRIGFSPETLMVSADQSEIAGRMRPSVFELDPLTINGRFDNLKGISSTASEGRVGAADLRLRPITREGELLETVPGVIVTQHSGDGKANQYFVRGFNLDHGTDFETRIEGMPVNMPSHAHGQGYTDLNFLIPELVDYIDYRLGVYHADLGDFGSAGGAEFHLKRRLDGSFAVAGAGENGLARFTAGASKRVGSGDLLFAGEAKGYNGPWEVAEKIRKFSGVASYSWDRGSSQFSVLGMAYHNNWNSSDQIPLRAVEGGLVNRFGEVDASDGGNTERYSLSGSWRRSGGNSAQEVQIFGIYSDLSLFSNFGYFLNDPVRGDQFNQREHRVVLGANAKHSQELEAFGVAHILRVGVQTRADIINGLGLYHTEARTRLGTCGRMTSASGVRGCLSRRPHVGGPGSEPYLGLAETSTRSMLLGTAP